MNKTVKFLGKRVSAQEAMRNNTRVPLCLVQLPRGQGYTNKYLAYPGGELRYIINAAMCVGAGNTEQEAATDLERILFRDFAELGELLGWEVER